MTEARDPAFALLLVAIVGSFVKAVDQPGLTFTAFGTSTRITISDVLLATLAVVVAARVWRSRSYPRSAFGLTVAAAVFAALIVLTAVANGGTALVAAVKLVTLGALLVGADRSGRLDRPALGRRAPHRRHHRRRGRLGARRLRQNPGHRQAAFLGEHDLAALSTACLVVWLRPSSPATGPIGCPSSQAWSERSGSCSARRSQACSASTSQRRPLSSRRAPRGSLRLRAGRHHRARRDRAHRRHVLAEGTRSRFPAAVVRPCRGRETRRVRRQLEPTAHLRLHRRPHLRRAPRARHRLVGQPAAERVRPVPPSGAGPLPGSAPRYFPTAKGVFIPQQTYDQVLYELGLVGIAALAALIGIAARDALRRSAAGHAATPTSSKRSSPLPGSPLFSARSRALRSSAGRRWRRCSGSRSAWSAPLGARATGPRSAPATTA